MSRLFLVSLAPFCKPFQLIVSCAPFSGFLGVLFLQIAPKFDEFVRRPFFCSRI